MKIFKVLITLSLLFCITFVFLHKHYTQVVYYPGNQNSFAQAANATHRILMICTVPNLGGVEIHSLNIYKALLKKGIPTIFLTAHNALIKQELIAQKLPFYTCNTFNISSRLLPSYFSFQPGIEKAILEICKKYPISIIHCNRLREAIAARKFTTKFPAHIFYTHHVSNAILPQISQLVDGMIGVNDSIAAAFNKQKEAGKFNHQKVTCIHPFFDEEQFLNFIPSLTREDFFQKTFKVTIKPNVPLLCMIAHFYEEKRKNQALLIKAAHKLIHEKKRPVQIVFAGYGDSTNSQKLAQHYNINDYTYFIGGTNQTPGLLYHSNINVLPSLDDAFGIVVLEGALMKKPTIVSHNIGAARTLIIDHQTGLLFENNNVESLVDKIEFLLDNPELAKQYGENVFHHALKKYSNDAKLEKLLAFYDQVAQQKI